jgi:phosphoglycerate dehydrogenase-like enzyme
VLGADALILWHNIPCTEAVIASLTRCRALIRNGVGYDSVDLQAAARRGIPVCNVPDYGTEEVADHAIALTLALCRQLFALDAEAKRLGWKIEVAAKMRRLRTLTFGLVGLGRIGIATALRAKALGFRVSFTIPTFPTACTRPWESNDRPPSTIAGQSDVLSIHCPSSPETRGLIGARELSLLKPTSFLINTARGDIVQKAPLFAALRAGHLAGAGLDVVEGEPLRTAEEAATPESDCDLSRRVLQSRRHDRNAHDLRPNRARRRARSAGVESRQLKRTRGAVQAPVGRIRRPARSIPAHARAGCRRRRKPTAAATLTGTSGK